MKRIAGIVAIVLISLTTSAQWTKPKDIPAYNAAPPRKGSRVTPIASGGALQVMGLSHPAQWKAYKVAAKNSDLMYQLPCYCYCDRNHGHNSLHSCFETDHGAECSVCMKEALYADQEAKKGKTAKQIRAAIIAGEHEKLDLNKVR